MFIVGLPRSGTTLIEQILASHPQVFGAGELTLARQDFEAMPGVLDRHDLPPADCIGALTADAISGSRRSTIDCSMSSITAMPRGSSTRCPTITFTWD